MAAEGIWVFAKFLKKFTKPEEKRTVLADYVRAAIERDECHGIDSELAKLGPDDVVEVTVKVIKR